MQIYSKNFDRNKYCLKPGLPHRPDCYSTMLSEWDVRHYILIADYARVDFFPRIHTQNFPQWIIHRLPSDYIVIASPSE